MIPLVIFLLACAAVYLGCIDSAFSALMRLSLRLQAERSGSPDSLGGVPRRSDPAVRAGSPAARSRDGGGDGADWLADRMSRGAPRFAIVMGSGAAFVGFFELLLPLLIVGRDPERVLDLLLPTFSPIARALAPMIGGLPRVLQAGKRPAAPLAPDEAPRTPATRRRRTGAPAEQDGIIGRRAAAAAEHRRLRRHAGPRGHDAAARHRRHPRQTRRSATCARCSASRSIRAFRSTRKASTTSRASCS